MGKYNAMMNWWNDIHAALTADPWVAWLLAGFLIFMACTFIFIARNVLETQRIHDIQNASWILQNSKDEALRRNAVRVLNKNAPVKMDAELAERLATGKGLL